MFTHLQHCPPPMSQPGFANWSFGGQSVFFYAAKLKLFFVCVFGKYFMNVCRHSNPCGMKGSSSWGGNCILKQRLDYELHATKNFYAGLVIVGSLGVGGHRQARMPATLPLLPQRFPPVCLRGRTLTTVPIVCPRVHCPMSSHS